MRRHPGASAKRLAAALGAAIAATAGCSAPAPGEAWRTAQQAIAGGQPAPDDTAVLGVVDFAGGQCSGSLIAPNLVLTAQHCVADTLDEVQGGVACGTTRFAAADSPGALFVLTLPEFSVDLGDYRAVTEIRVPPGEDEFCGRDLALLFLADPIADDVALPLPPRVDVEPAPGEVYSAVGYGAQDDQGQGSGQRRRRDGLVLDCVGEACAESSVAETEWLGDEGTCKGDSGGPALDALGRVLGAVSAAPRAASPRSTAASTPGATGSWRRAWPRPRRQVTRHRTGRSGSPAIPRSPTPSAASARTTPTAPRRRAPRM
ncbi:MAG: trypsin-like serine protease [Polyangiaceae bacterium]